MVSKLTMNVKCFHIALAIWLLAAIPIGFAEDFQNRPALFELNELVNQGIVSGKAVRERDVVANRNVNFFPYCGTWQPYFASLQSELEYLPTSYVDHANGPLNAGKTGFLYFTLATWRSAAGLSTNGFRRATDQVGEFSYGYAQVGDAIGSWIFEDLQNGLKALKWTLRGVSIYEYPTETHKYLNVWGHGWETPEAHAAFISAFNAQAWTSTSGNCGYRVAGSSQPAGIYGWSLYAERVRGQQTLGFVDIPRTIHVYMKASSEGFVDVDEMGFVPDEYTLMRDESETFDTTVVLDYFGNINNCPISLLPEIPGAAQVTLNALTRYIIKWKFTYGEE